MARKKISRNKEAVSRKPEGMRLNCLGDAQGVGDLLDVLKELKRWLDGIYSSHEVIQFINAGDQTFVRIQGLPDPEGSCIAVLMLDLSRGGRKKSYESVDGFGQQETRRVRRPAYVVGALREAVRQANITLRHRMESADQLFTALGELA